MNKNLTKNVVCMKWGTKFGSEYVNRLFAMVEKNLTLQHRFICFTDDSNGINPKIEIMPLPVIKDDGLTEKGWKKLGIFSKMENIEGQVLFLDLDIIIRSNIDCLFEVDGEFRIIKDWDFPHDIIGNSSVFRFEANKHSDIIEHFYNYGIHIRDSYKNEQAFLSHEMDKKGILQYWDFSWCVSFKRNCLQKFPMCYIKEAREPINAKILIFHGRPTPQQALDGFCGKGGLRYVKPTSWLKKYFEESQVIN